MSPQEDDREDGAIHRPRRLPASNFVIPGSGARNNPPSLSYEMLLCNNLDVCVLPPCIPQPGCPLNNVNSLTDALKHCPMYGVEHIFNK